MRRLRGALLQALAAGCAALSAAALALGLLLLWSADARAQDLPEVAVRSGEHVDFSRLVLGLDASDGWELGRVPGGYEFRLNGAPVRFDLGEVFTYIPRRRIAAVDSPAPGVLRLQVACACHVDGFELRRSRVVIDVKDGPPAPGSPFEAPLPPRATTATDALAAAGQARRDPATPETEPVADPAPDRIAPHDAPTLQAVLPLGLPAAPAAAPELERTLDLTAAEAERAQTLQSDLLGQLSRAVGQGLAQPAVEIPVLPPATPAPGDETATEHSAPASGPAADHAAPGPAAASPADAHAPQHHAPEPHAPDLHGPDQQAPDPQASDPHGPSPAEGQDPAGGQVPPQMRIETAVDRAARGRPRPEVTDDGHACPDPDDIDIATWGRMVGGLPDIAAARAGVTGELDRPDPARAMELARYYTWLGFGAEAQQALALVPADRPGRAEVAALAALMDAGLTDATAQAAPVFGGYLTCPGPAALWAVLARGRLAPGDTVDGGAVVQAFAALPAHLKDLLGAPLIEAFTGSGRLEQAAALRNALAGAVPQPSMPARIAAAGVDAAAGRMASAEHGLQTALVEADPDSAEALLALARTRMAGGHAPDQALASALEALAFERRDTPLAPELWQVLARTRLMQHDYRAARDLILGPLAQDPPVAAGLARDLYAQAAGSAPDDAFLRLVLPAPQALGQGPEDAPARRAVAARLAGLGFAGDALAVLPAQRRDDPAARQIAARAQLDAGRPDAALVELRQLPGPEAAALAGAAEEALGHFAAAADRYRAAGRPAEADRMQLLAADAGQSPAPAAVPVAPGQAVPAVPLASPVAPRSGSPPPPGDLYAAARRALAAARDDRALIDAALSGAPPAAPPGPRPAPPPADASPPPAGH